MWQLKNVKIKTILLGLCCSQMFFSSWAIAEPTATGDDSEWNTLLDEPQVNNSKSSDVKDTKEESQDKYLEATHPPKKATKMVNIFLENKSKPQGFLTSYITKRADTDLILEQHQPSSIPVESRFQVSNFGHYIRLGHEQSDKLVGYSKNYFGFTSVYLEKDYFEKRDFWTRFIVAPSGEKDWYLIRSYTEPKKCLTIGWSQKLRLSRCNINDKWQKWRFLREKSDAYWVPDMQLMDLDIM